MKTFLTITVLMAVTLLNAQTYSSLSTEIGYDGFVKIGTNGGIRHKFFKPYIGINFYAPAKRKETYIAPMAGIEFYLLKNTLVKPFIGGRALFAMPVKKGFTDFGYQVYSGAMIKGFGIGAYFEKMQYLSNAQIGIRLSYTNAKSINKRKSNG